MKYVIGNQKTYLSYEDAMRFMETRFPSAEGIQMILCPSMAYLSSFLDKGYVIGSQNVAYQDISSTTGEVTVSQLKSMDVCYSIVGHSERRMYQKETDEVISEKVKLLLDNDMVPILCIGETKQERDERVEYQVIEKQLQAVFCHQEQEKLQNIIIAYEPIWAIGSGMVPTKEEIHEMMLFIKSFGKKYQVDLKVLYGGSVNSKNIAELNEIPSLDGYLVGGASTKKEEWETILNTIIDQEKRR